MTLDWLFLASPFIVSPVKICLLLSSITINVDRSKIVVAIRRGVGPFDPILTSSFYSGFDGNSLFEFGQFAKVSDEKELS